MLRRSSSTSEKMVTTAFETECFRLTKKLQCCVGQWPLQSKIHKGVLRTLCFVSLATAFPILCFGIVDLWDIKLVAICRGAPPLLTLIAGMAKYNVYIIYEKEIREIIFEFGIDWDIIRKEEERQILQQFANKARKIASFYTGYVFFSLVVMLMSPCLPIILNEIIPSNTTVDRILLFPANFWPHADADHYYWPLVAYIDYISFVLITMVIASDCLYIILVCHGCSIFAITRYMFEHSAGTKEWIDYEVEYNDNDATLECKNRTARKNLARCIEMHKKAIRYALVLESCYTWSFFLIIGCNMIIISVTGMLAILRFEVWEESLPAIVFCTCQFLHLYLLSLPGQMLYDESSCISASLYNSFWYTLPPRCQQLLILVMARSGRPSLMTAGKFFVLKMETFSAVLLLILIRHHYCTEVVQTSMSYLTVLASFQ